MLEINSIPSTVSQLANREYGVRNTRPIFTCPASYFITVSPICRRITVVVVAMMVQSEQLLSVTEVGVELQTVGLHDTTEKEPDESTVATKTLPMPASCGA